MRKVISILLMAGFIFYVLSLVSGLFIGDAGNEPGQVGRAVLEGVRSEAGSANAVTSVVVLYRGFDTLGEVTVLFLAASGIALLLGHGSTRRDEVNGTDGSRRDGAAGKEETEDETAWRVSNGCAADTPGFILKTGGRVLYPFIFLFGWYVVAHGHLSPGGGFPGGVIIATGFFTALLTGDVLRIPEGLFSFFEGLAGLGFIGLGLIGLFGGDASFLAQVFPLGNFGTLFSAGIIPFIYAVIGIKVAAELAGAVGRFYTTQAGGAE